MTTRLLTSRATDETNLLLSLSAKQRRNPFFFTRHDWPVKKATVILPIRLKEIRKALAVIRGVSWGHKTRIFAALLRRRYFPGLNYVCDAGCSVNNSANIC